MNKRNLSILMTILFILSGGNAASRSAYAALSSAQTDNLVTISDGKKPILEYRQTPNPGKVYVSKLYTPSGIQILLDSPSDHVHHHALMYALDSGKNIWWMDGEKMGKQVPATKAETKDGTITHQINWNSSAGETILKEARTITVHEGADIPATLLSWTTVLSVSGKKSVPLATTRHYAGLGIRFDRKMDKIGRFIFPDHNDATGVRRTEKVTSADWCAYLTELDGKPITVAMFSAPSNLRHPTYWFTMTAPFAYISATLNLYRAPHTLRPGMPLDLTYGIAVFDRKQDKAGVKKAYETWLKLWPEKKAPPEWEDTHVNIADPKLGVKVTASSVYGPGYEPEKIMDGKWAVRETDKWNSKLNVTPHFLQMDLAKEQAIDCIKIFHEGAVNNGGGATTSDFLLQHSASPEGPWTNLVEPVKGNSAGITEHFFDEVKTRYIRLLIETGEQNGGNQYARIFEVQVFKKK